MPLIEVEWLGDYRMGRARALTAEELRTAGVTEKAIKQLAADGLLKAPARASGITYKIVEPLDGKQATSVTLALKKLGFTIAPARKLKK